MIINLRGTSGSGKSTLIRRVMEQYEQKVPYRVHGRRQPLGYVLQNPSKPEQLPLAIPGHYETPCGGCDTITSMETIFELVRISHNRGQHVLFEGLLISADGKRTIDLHDAGFPVKVIALSTPLAMCLDSVNARRVAKKPDATPVNPKNTESKFKGVQSSMRRLSEHGVDCQWASRAEAFEIICRELGL